MKSHLYLSLWPDPGETVGPARAKARGTVEMHGGCEDEEKAVSLTAFYEDTFAKH